jgi:photosystem II stability/assembly factor-like uncharacterized protein
VISKLTSRLFCALVFLPVAATAADYTFLPALPVADAHSEPLLDIARCESNLLAVGERGLIIYSRDGGVNWQQADVPVSQTLTSVYCLPTGLAWATGHSGVILASTDGGVNWTLQFDGDQVNQQWLAYTKAHEEALQAALETAADEDLDDLEYEHEDAIFAIEDAEAAIEIGPADPFLDIWFRDDQYGIAVGAYGMLYRTLDGGDNWAIMAGGIDNPDRYHYYSITSNREGLLFLSGEAGLLYRSADQGISWESLDAGYEGSLFGLVVSADQAVMGFGLRGNIFRSTDLGETWLPALVENNPRLSLYGGARLSDDSIALVGAAGALLTSTDNGQRFKANVLRGRNTLSAVAGDEITQALAVGMGGLEPASGAIP